MRSDASMGVFTRCLRTPVTTLCLILLAMVYAATYGWGDTSGASERARALGFVGRLTWVTNFPDRTEVWYDQLYGPFELWDGEWWRIPLTTLHHAGFWHLFLNSLFVAIYGALLERNWGSWRYALFLVTAAFVCMLPDYLLEHYVLGFSGVACAIYGALCGLRRYRPEVAAVITLENVAGTLAMLVGMVILTEVGLLQIANVAHFTGLAYGWVTALVVAVPWSYPAVIRASFLVSHLLLIGPYWLAVHPFWNGRYHWYVATRGPDGKPQTAGDATRLRLAVAWDPTLTPVWTTLADQALAQNQPLAAWDDLLRGLQARPVDDEMLKTTRRLWRRLAVSDQRSEALAATKRIFGDSTNAWLAQIRRITPPPVLVAPDRPPSPTQPQVKEVVTQVEWTPPEDMWWWRTSPSRVIPMSPDDPHSAMHGETM